MRTNSAFCIAIHGHCNRRVSIKHCMLSRKNQFSRRSRLKRVRSQRFFLIINKQFFKWFAASRFF